MMIILQILFLAEFEKLDCYFYREGKIQELEINAVCLLANYNILIVTVWLYTSHSFRQYVIHTKIPYCVTVFWLTFLFCATMVLVHALQS